MSNLIKIKTKSFEVDDYEFIQKLKEVVIILKRNRYIAITQKSLKESLGVRLNNFEFIQFSERLGLKVHKIGRKRILAWDFDDILNK